VRCCEVRWSGRTRRRVGRWETEQLARLFGPSLTPCVLAARWILTQNCVLVLETYITICDSTCRKLVRINVAATNQTLYLKVTHDAHLQLNVSVHGEATRNQRIVITQLELYVSVNYAQ
jgi:hypothetical protein